MRPGLERAGSLRSGCSDGVRSWPSTAVAFEAGSSMY